MTRLSASGVPRALACPASLVLPRVPYHTADAEAGEDRHADMEAAIDIGDTGVLPAAVQALIREGDELATECAFAYDVATDTGRALGHIKRRDYASKLTPYEIPGTIDLLVRGNGRAIVVDKKGFLKVGPAETNEQTMTYALAVARTMGLDEVTVVIFYEIGGVDIAEIGPLDLDAHAARLKQLQVTEIRARQALRAGTIGEFTRTGPHCRYCESYFACEKQQAFALEMADLDTPMRVETMIPFADDEGAAAAFDLLARIKILTARIQAAIYARAAERPIPLPDGRMFGPVEKNGPEKLDGDVAYAVIRELHGQAIADAAVERKATKTKLKEALRYAGGKSVAAAERAVLAEIRKRGGSKQETRTAIEVYEPKKELKAG